MYVSIPPKLSVSKVAGKIKGKSNLMLFDRCPEYREIQPPFLGERDCSEAIGNVNEATIKKYIAEQYERDRL